MNKYRWHNLEKDPKDLPKEGTHVLYAIMYFKEVIAYGVAYFTKNGFEGGNDTIDKLNKYVFAWKYIEEFEDEKQSSM